MRLLLDTHVLIWWVEDNEALGKKARSAITKAQEIYVSYASGWEFAIKKSSGKWDIRMDFEAAINGESFVHLPINYRHIRAIAGMKNIHGDPFDRMLVAQSIVDDLCLVTADQKMLKYPVKLIDARK